MQSWRITRVWKVLGEIPLEFWVGVCPPFHLIPKEQKMPDTLCPVTNQYI